MRSLVLSIATASALIAAALYGYDRMENPQRQYAALTDEVFQGGWVPKLLPPTAASIRTQHNIDTNDVWVRFNLGTSEFNPIKQGFQLVPPAGWPKEAKRPRHADWWFSSMSEFSPGSAKFYTGDCSAGEVGAPRRSGHMLVVGGEVYLWCGGGAA
jgi:hypothetical protein